MKKIVTIGWWNGQSNLLDAFYRYLDKDIEISSIVSMSDDWRTTWKLMREFEKQLNLHLPPPWDLRRCLFMMSDSKKRDEFKQYLETVIERDFKINSLTIKDYFSLVWAWKDFLNHLKSFNSDFLDFSLALSTSIKWHKVWNILMANLYYNLGKDYYKMLKLMHKILEVKAEIIPVTTKKAYIEAILWNWDIIKTQDRISNVASYTSWIADLRLMQDSKNAYQHKNVFKAIKKADYIIITPWDLFTSIISNFVIWWVKEVIKKTQAKIIYIWNSTNKWWETSWLTHLDFINKVERFLGRRIDIFICNNKIIKLSKEERQKFKNHISIKWWDFLYLSDWEKSELTRRKIKFIEEDLLDKISLYKHNQKNIVKVLKNIINNIF